MPCSQAHTHARACVRACLQERTPGKKLRGLMKVRLIRFALWSLQSRDEGVDKEGAKRLKEKRQKGRLERGV